jgi:ferric-dicitrate binding protein FerR (iron transport regulator)
MSAILTPVATDLLEGLRDGDEAALEQLFRDHYEGLVIEARSRLRDPARAPAIVQEVFEAAWHRRTEFASGDALERWLHDAVGHAAARDRARHAVMHRYDHAVTAAHGVGRLVPVGAAWARLEEALHAPPPDPARAARVRHEASRQVAAQHVAGIAAGRSWRGSTIVGAAALLLSLPAFYWLNRAGADASVSAALVSDQARVHSARAGQRAEITLADGSTALLFADSKLRVPRQFGAELRAVALEGAASIAATPSATHPLEVRVGAARILANDARFVARYFAEDESALIRVSEGAISVRAGESLRVLNAGEVLAVSGDGGMSAPLPAVAGEALSFTTGRLVAGDVTVREGLRLLARWYALDLAVDDEVLLDRPASVNASLVSPREAIASLERSAGLRFDWEGEAMVLRDARARR